MVAVVASVDQIRLPVQGTVADILFFLYMYIYVYIYVILIIFVSSIFPIFGRFVMFFMIFVDLFYDF